jgi:hypothetical protein
MERTLREKSFTSKLANQHTHDAISWNVIDFFLESGKYMSNALDFTVLYHLRINVLISVISG